MSAELAFSHDERDLLLWLSKEDWSQYGECYGRELDRLVELGLAKVHGEETEANNPFIAKGRGIMFRAVSLTEKGVQAARALERVAELEAKLKAALQTVMVVSRIDIRAAYAAGETAASIAKRHGLPEEAIREVVRSGI